MILGAPILMQFRVYFKIKQLHYILPHYSLKVNSLRVEPISKATLIHRCNQEFMHINITLFSEKRQRGIY